MDLTSLSLDIHFRLTNRKKDGRSLLKVWWNEYSHPAASIFFHHGWQHPILRYLPDCCMKDNHKEELRMRDNHKEELLSLRKLEAPIVIKERFNLMKEKGNTPAAIALARVAGGDHECMHYLLANGLASEAMVQASIHKNFGGLVRLSQDLALTNPCASVLCIQAHILGGIDTHDPENRELSVAIDNLAIVLIKAWFTNTAVEEHNDPFNLPVRVPPLRLLTTISLARVFLCAAKSTSEMQAILEKQHWAEAGLSPLLATIAITSCATKETGLHLGLAIEHLLKRMDLLSVRKQQSKVSFALTDFISGSLTDFRSVPEGLSGETYLDLICFLYESAKFLMEEGCRSVFCFTLALFSSVQIGVRTGCESFALDVIRSLNEAEEGHFDFKQYGMSSPLSSLSTCFSALFTICGYDVCQNIQQYILETFLQMKAKPPGSYYNVGNFKIGSRAGLGSLDRGDDVNHSQVWMAIAYTKYKGTKAAGSALSDHIISNYMKIDEMIMESLTILKTLDTSPGDDDYVVASRLEENTMHSFVNSDKRERLTALKRNEMISAFISQTLGTATFLAHDTIGKLYLRYTAIDPLFFNRNREEVKSRLSNISGLTLALSKKSCLFTTCILMHYIQDSPYMVLELGLSWLRNALSSQKSLVLFDNAEFLNDLVDMKHDRAGTYSRFFDTIAYDLDGRPKLAAKALVAVLDANIVGILEETPPSWLSDLCNETLVLCRALDVFIEPTLKRVGDFEDAWRKSSIQLRKDKLPSFFHPRKLVSIVVDPQWCAKPDFSAGHTSTYRFRNRCEEFSPFLNHRVIMAVEYGFVNEAAKLCVTALNDDFWGKLSYESTDESFSGYYGMRDTMIEIRAVLRACLHIIINGALFRRADLSDDFVNSVLHLILSMNWFRACDVCSPDSRFVSEHAQKFVVSLDHVDTVHEIAMEWSDLLDATESPFGQSLSHCLNVIRCISRCIYVLEEGDFRRRNVHITACCSFRQDEGGEVQHKKKNHQNTAKEDTEGTSNGAEEIARPIKKRKMLASSIDSNFKELEAFALQLAMKQQCDWCKDAIRRVGIEESNEIQT